jgi:phosphohistidine phosphatase SixA
MAVLDIAPKRVEVVNEVQVVWAKPIHLDSIPASLRGKPRVLFLQAQEPDMRLPRTSLLLFLFVFTHPCPSIQAQEETLIFLVRHAERADDGQMTGQEDPHLSEAGCRRADALAEMLKDVGLTHIHSSDVNRTRETGAPAARISGLEIHIYDRRDSEGFAHQLLSTPGRHLVVGHSNTIPALVEALGGDSHGEIGHLEYDRLYLVVPGPEGVRTVLLRFGEAASPH